MKLNSLATRPNGSSNDSGEIPWLRLLLAAGILVLSGGSPSDQARADTLAVSGPLDNKIYNVSSIGTVSPLATINYYPEGVVFGPGSTTLYCCPGPALAWSAIGLGPRPRPRFLFAAGGGLC